MRVSIDCRYLRERPSGVGNYVRALVDHVPALAPDDAFQLWMHPQGPRTSAPNVTQCTVHAPANGVRTLLIPSRLVDLSHADVAHATFNTLGHGIACPTVVTIHDLMWLEHPRWCARPPWLPFQYAYYRHGILHALAHASRLIAISSATADAIRARVARPERVTVIHHGVHDRFTRAPPSASALQRMGITRPFFLVVGQNAPYKNHAAIIDAFTAANLRGVELVMVQRLHRHASRIGVRVLSTVSDAQLIALYRATLGLVQFSRWEGFGLPALEAAACGAPVIASAIPALDEVLADASLRVPLTIRALCTAMQRLAAEPSLRADLAASGAERARGFRWQDSAAAHLDVYRAAAERPVM